MQSYCDDKVHGSPTPAAIRFFCQNQAQPVQMPGSIARRYSQGEDGDFVASSGFNGLTVL